MPLPFIHAIYNCAAVVQVPAFDLVLHVARFEPFVPQDSWCVAVTKPLGPRGMVIVEVLQRHRRFALDDHAGSSGVQFAAKLRCTLAHGVEENAVPRQWPVPVLQSHRDPAYPPGECPCPRDYNDVHADATAVKPFDNRP